MLFVDLQQRKVFEEWMVVGVALSIDLQHATKKRPIGHVGRDPF